MALSSGQLVAIVGPSGVGKDSVMEGVKKACPEVELVRRVITRDAGAGGENFDSVSEQAFERLRSQGAFALHWQAHGLRYGIPISINGQIADGKIVMFNGSRAALPIAQELYPDMKIVVITAKPETLAHRLKNRGRESEDDIKRRLARASYQAPEGPNVYQVSNDGELSETIISIKSLLNLEVENAQ